MKAIGAYEAKTHLAQLLNEVARGETVTITRHGVPVAILAPPRGKGLPDSGAAIDSLRAFRRGVTLGGLSLGEIIEQGRK